MLGATMKAGRVEASKAVARSHWKKGGTYPTAPRDALPMLLPCSLLALRPLQFPIRSRMAFGCKKKSLHWRGWDTGLLAKLQLKEEKEATKVVEDQVKGGAMAWRRKAAESKAEKEAAAAAAEQQAKNQALFTATVQGNVEDVTRLLAEGAEVDAVNGAGQTVTQLAEERERPAVIKAVVAHISDSLFTAVMDVWASFTAYEKAEEEGGGAEATQPSPSPRATTPGGTPLGTALPENSEVSAVIKEDRALQDAIGRAQPVLDAIVGLEALLTEKAARESSAAIHKEVLKQNKKKLAALKKFKRRMQALENRRKEKEAKWRAEVGLTLLSSPL